MIPRHYNIGQIQSKETKHERQALLLVIFLFAVINPLVPSVH